MIETLVSDKQTINKTILSKKNLSIIIDEIVDLIIKEDNKGVEKKNSESTYGLIARKIGFQEFFN